MGKKTGPKSNWKLTEDTIRKLETAFSWEASVTEACAFAGISSDSYYRWIKEKPELSDKFKRLMLNPILKARKTVIDGLQSVPTAQWYLERKRKGEFGSRQEIEHKGELKVTLNSEQVEEIIKRRTRGISPIGKAQPDRLQHTDSPKVPSKLAPRGPGRKTGEGGKGGNKAVDSDDAAKTRKEPADNN